MEISIDQELQCQALLAYRYGQDMQEKSYYGRAAGEPRVKRCLEMLTYTVLDSDPIPKGLQAGDIIYGALEKIDNGEIPIPYAVPLPIFTNHSNPPKPERRLTRMPDGTQRWVEV